MFLPYHGGTVAIVAILLMLYDFQCVYLKYMKMAEMPYHGGTVAILLML